MDVVVTLAASLPTDILLEIFLHLEPSAVVSCAGVCKPWRRAIIHSARILGPHLDRFSGPSLLLGVFHHRNAACLRRTPWTLNSALPWTGSGDGDDDNEIPANSLVPGAAAAAALPSLLSSMDGFILLKTRSVNSLCLCNPMTGYSAIVPAAATIHNMYIHYLLLTGSSTGNGNDGLAVRILAVHRRRHCSNIYVSEEALAYQLFAMCGDSAGMWGPVAKLEAGHGLYVRPDCPITAIGEDTVCWLADAVEQLKHACVFGVDISTGRTWTTQLPTQCYLPILGMCGDGRLSLVHSVWGPCIKVWVLSGDSQWTLQQTIPIDVSSLLPYCVTRDIERSTYLSAFCPRSRCVIALWSDLELLIDIDASSSSPRIRRIGKRKGIDCYPYELDCWSTYISKMKSF